MSSPLPLDPCTRPDLRHLRRLTDAFGIYQHTERDVPHRAFGYALDDVARALIIVVRAAARDWPSSVEASGVVDAASLQDLAERYLRFLAFCQMDDGRFHNFVSVERSFADVVVSEDAHGRAIWALGVTAASAVWSPARAEAGHLLRKGLEHAEDVSALRAQAFTVLGLLAVLSGEDPLKIRSLVGHLLERLCHAYEDAASEDWPWFEEVVRYSNGVLPYALLAANRESIRTFLPSSLTARARAIGLRSLDFLLTFTVNGVPTPVGNSGWYPRGGQRALYDQQCVDVAAVVVASAEAFAVTGDSRYREAALTWWRWFFGSNIRQQSLYRVESGAVRDGLHAVGVSENQGAESVVAFLLAHLALAEVTCGKSAGTLP